MQTNGSCIWIRKLASMAKRNLVPRVLLGTKVPWWIVVTWVRFKFWAIKQFAIVFFPWTEINIF